MSELVSVNKTAPPTLATVIGPFAFEKANINSELLGSLVITPIGGPYVIVTVEQYDADVQYQGGTGKVGNKRAWDSLKNGKVEWPIDARTCKGGLLKWLIIPVVGAAGLLPYNITVQIWQNGMVLGETHYVGEIDPGATIGTLLIDGVRIS